MAPHRSQRLRMRTTSLERFKRRCPNSEWPPPRTFSSQRTTVSQPSRRKAKPAPPRASLTRTFFPAICPPDFWHWIWGRHWRSEEHTSELQSQSNLVCRLLLEKKKT